MMATTTDDASLLREARDLMEAITAQFVLGEPLSGMLHETHERICNRIGYGEDEP